jgi:hypothetical protein
LELHNLLQELLQFQDLSQLVLLNLPLELPQFQDLSQLVLLNPAQLLVFQFQILVLLLLFHHQELHHELLELPKLKLQLNLVSVVMEFVKELNNAIPDIVSAKDELFLFSKEHLAVIQTANS